MASPHMNLNNSRSILILCLIVAPTLRVQAQTPTGVGAIVGTVIDSSTSLPVEGAIAYVAMSGIGTSTDTAGRFFLPLVPGGVREIVVSRVGYRRVVLNTTVTSGDTTRLAITLAGVPVPVPGGEVTAESPGTIPSAPLFFPDGGDRAWCAYGSETEVPVGILYTEKLLFFYHLDTVRSDEEEYVRLWLLVYNGSEDTLEFDAPVQIRLDVSRGGRSYRDVKPDWTAPSTSVTPAASATPSPPEPALDDIAPPRNLPVERTLYVLASQSQLFIDEADRFDRMGGGPFLGWLNPKDHPHGVSPRHLRDVYDRCLHDGRLKRYRFAPGTGVDGRVVYPMPGFGSLEENGTAHGLLSLRFDVHISTPTSEERIVFSMH